MKLCGSFCGEWKPIENFYKNPLTKGHRWACKKCLTRYQRELRHDKKFHGLSDARFSVYESNLKRLREIIPEAKKQGRLWSHPTRLIDGIEEMKAGLILERYAEGGLHEGWCLHVRLSGRFEVFPLASYKYTTLALHLAEKDIEIL